MDYEIFVGRSEYLSEAMRVVHSLATNDEANSPEFILIIGPGGIGKTKLTTKIGALTQNLGMLVSHVIDLKAINNRSELTLLWNLAQSLGPSDFIDFINKINSYNQSRDLEKYVLRERAINAFTECIAQLSKKAPVLLIIDTFESIQEMDFSQWIIGFLSNLKGRIGIIIAGRNPIELTNVHILNIYLKPFLQKDSKELAHKLFEQRGIEYDLEDQDINCIHKLSKGKPILVTLAIEWILENAPTEDITKIPQDKFEQELVIHIRKLKDQTSLPILLMSIASHRFDAQIMSIFTGYSIPFCEAVCSDLKKFSFVKVRQDDNVLVLHDEMLHLIIQYIDLPDTYKNINRQKLVEEYYNRDISNTKDLQFKQMLIAEKIYYEYFYDPEEAMCVYDEEMQLAIESYDFNYCSLLSNEINRHEMSPMYSSIVRLCRAEMLIQQYRPSEAKIILDRLKTNFPNPLDSRYYCRILVGLGASIVNPCTIVGVSPMEALDYLNQSIVIAKSNNYFDLLPRIFYWLGNAFGSIGDYEKAEKAYLNCIEEAKRSDSKKIITKALCELGRLYRLQQNVQKAFDPLQESLTIRREIKDEKNLGISYYYLGNVYRDLNDFRQADVYYERAESGLIEIGDDFNLCRLYADISWMAFLEDNYDRAFKYVEKSYELSNHRQFGTEISEYWHILYEISIALGDRQNAYLYLEKALYFAKKYNNFYMILDCLNHETQRAYTLKEYGKIPNIINEMLDLENLGCGIKVFRGRAMMVYGDALFDENNLKEAFLQWSQGLKIIALYGNSRTNVELFDDIFKQRQRHLKKTLGSLGIDTIILFKSDWKAAGLDKDFPSIIDLCESEKNC